MVDAEADELRARLAQYVGKPMGAPSVAPDPVNVPMIRHWVDALDDRNPVYLDEAFAATTRFGGIVAPPAMLQVWGMRRPRIEGIAERGGAPDEIDPDNPIPVLDAAGYVGTLATNSELEFVRYLRPGDQLSLATELESISDRKTTALGSSRRSWGSPRCASPTWSGCRAEEAAVRPSGTRRWRWRRDRPR